MPVNSSELVGMVLGTCTLEMLIGRGGMSCVYLARQHFPERYVAVKILLPHLLTQDLDRASFLARFQHEANIIARLEHVNIVPIFTYGQQDQLAYLIMPYIPGGTLAQMLEQQKKLSIQQTLIYIEQAAAALDYAHSQGVIHRDLKPSNFLLYPDGRLVLADFGIARLIQHHEPLSHTLTPAGMLLGTPLYMAPEIIYGKPADQRSDIYALGIILFQMLSGELPFQGENTFALLSQQVQQPIPSLHRLNPLFSNDVDIVLQKATAKEREERYPSAGALVQALKHALSWSCQITLFENTGRILETPSIPYTPPHSTFPLADNPLTPASSRETPQKSSATPFSMWLLCGLLLIVMLAIFLGLHGSSDTPLSLVAVPSTPAETEQAKKVVQRYYKNLNQKDYQAAFELLSPQFQQSIHGLAHFTKGYQDIRQQTLTFKESQLQANGTIVVVVSLSVEAANKQRNIYLWRGILRKQPDTWKITQAHLCQLAGRASAFPRCSPTNQAKWGTT
ncbi:serine/threonine-protein kinase [Tengunoibacter tsumagoiensis]|uniref:non-specific serine/threonine protein kinase n=1 Tax=Tengunoibacter tsumagoiensis TaxID=2014871 RepID=A0A401ZZH2_9CHLR|nr:serine/threonine-protein kinase [Tengunoibacter tsumagoiensis]GCE12202.1 hypothetical protein KTT_20610 [Tengunoibacter tsumagoiensis]